MNEYEPKIWILNANYWETNEIQHFPIFHEIYFDQYEKLNTWCWRSVVFIQLSLFENSDKHLFVAHGEELKLQHHCHSIYLQPHNEYWLKCGWNFHKTLFLIRTRNLCNLYIQHSAVITTNYRIHFTRNFVKFSKFLYKVEHLLILFIVYNRRAL